MMGRSGTRYLTAEECIGKGMIPLEIVRAIGLHLSPEDKGSYTTQSDDAVFSAKESIKALEMKVEKLTGKLKTLEDKMCERCRDSDKKDVEDYYDNSNSVNFIITHDKQYYKQQSFVKYQVQDSGMSSPTYWVTGSTPIGTAYIEKFTKKVDAEAFLAELIEQVDE